MHAIEARAAALFADHGFPLVGAEPTPRDTFFRFARENTAFVAAGEDDRPLGFAVAGEVAGIFWLKELGVDPDVMCRGIGSALVEAVAVHASAAGYRRIGLSTFRDVPFNAPFYVRRGYRIIDPESESDAIRAQFEREVPDGASRADRVLMMRNL